LFHRGSNAAAGGDLKYPVVDSRGPTGNLGAQESVLTKPGPYSDREPESGSPPAWWRVAERVRRMRGKQPGIVRLKAVRRKKSQQKPFETGRRGTVGRCGFGGKKERGEVRGHVSCGSEANRHR